MSHNVQAPREPTTEELTSGDWPQLLDYVLRKTCPPNSNDGVERPTHDAYAAGLVMRVGSLLRGGQTLLEKGLATEAGVLARALFTDSLRLQHLAAAGEDRAGIILGWHLEALKDFEGIAVEAFKAGVAPDLADTRAALEAERKKARRYANRHGLQIKRGFPAEKEMARRYDRMQGYVDFRYSHHSVHGSTVALLQRSNLRNSDGVLEIGVPQGGDDKQDQEAIAWFAADSALHARLAANQIFGWPEPSGIRALLTAIHVEREKTALASSSPPT